MSSFDINIDDGSKRTVKAKWSTDFQVDGSQHHDISMKKYQRGKQKM
jgi:hypothetical protein